MQGVVMAGGRGQRLQPLTFDVPKPFLPVAGRPVVEWGILSLARAGITDVIVTTAYKAEVLREHLGDGDHLGVTLQYAEEETPLGTAGGVKNAEHLLDGPFVVMSGDVVADVDIGRLVDFHKSRGNALATIALTQVEDPTAYGIVGIDNDGRIERFKEKPTREEVFSDLTNSGIFVVEREVLERIPKETKFDWSKDLWTKMVGEPIYGMPLEGHWKDVGHPGDLLEANRTQCRRIDEERFGTVNTHESADVRDSVLMDGVTIGSEAQVHDSLLMERVEVGEGARIENTILAKGAKVGPGATLRDCVIGQGVEVPPEVAWTGRREPQPEAEAQERLAAGKA